MSVPQRHIFLSHSHLDNEFGTRLAQDLRRMLADESAVWYDVLGSLHGGDTWWEKIVDELTARPVFMVILSPDAIISPWVRDEINLAWKQKNSKAGKLILPLLYRECKVREDLDTLQVISFLSPRSYESAFNEILRALGVSIQQDIPTPKTSSQPEDAAKGLMRQMEAAFADQDWSDVIRKADYLIKRVPGTVSSTVYRLQGLALLEEGEVQQAQEALESALALVSDRQQRLTLLGDYTALLARQEQWSKVLQRAKEALRLVPNDPGWLAIQQQAQSKLAKPAAVPIVPPSVPKKTKEQWAEEARVLIDSKQYEEALAASEQALRLDPNYAIAYHNKGTALYDLERYEEALAAFEQALRLDPNYALAYNGKGAALADLKRDEEALAAYEHVLRLNPSYAPAYSNKGATLADLKRHEEALAAYEQALRLDPNYAVAYYNKALALERLGKKREAQQAYDKAKSLGYPP